ncbi:MAG: hypothetical protein IPM79_21150 [Polyangiaceae bacterium]|jgi:hypothetical protein|nr:hypothetical protein [Polyangiaceae bacterium]MBK8940055.1 hypothetical protein [Polyangiaceae bacterium]
MRSSVRLIGVLSCAALSSAACTSGAPASEAPASSSQEVASASLSVAASSSAPAALSTAAPAAASVSAAASTASPAASAEAPPLPKVGVKNIGIHIGGGPTDDEGMKRTKGPIKRSVEPHFDAFKRCFAKVDEPKKGGDVSVDLRVEKEGGKASLKKYKSALKGEGFEACIRAVYEGIDFEKPADGATMVSYSLRFTPEK